MSETKEDKELKEEIKKIVDSSDFSDIKQRAEFLSMLIRAFEGKPIEPEDVITRLTNVKNLLERSRFPTYPLLAKQVYLRLMADLIPEASACKKWADFEAQALIEYKGEGRKEYTEGIKGMSSPEQMFFMGNSPRPQEAKTSRLSRFRRSPKEESEFVNQ